MSWQTDITQAVANLTNRLNQITTSARKIFELDWQNILNPASKIHVSNPENESEFITVQQILDAALSYRQNQLIEATISVLGNDVTVDAGADWIINNINHELASDFTETVDYAETGYTRNDILVGDESNLIYRIVGPETEGISPTPNTPLNTVLVTVINVTDSTIGYVPPVVLDITTDDVLNNSDVDGATATDAFNSLDTALENVYNTRVKVEYPDIFTFRPFTIYEKNSRYYTDFKVSSLVSDKISKMLPYYVNFASGNNTNDGKTPATAFKTISYAYGIGARLIYLSKGVHLSSWGSLNPSYTNIDDFFVIGASDGVSIVTNAPAAFPTFSLVSGTAYSATVISNTLAVDLKYSDSYGFPLKLKEVFTQAECIAELGTFYKNANVITVNLEDGRVPDSNVLIPASTPNADYSGNAGYHYIKDITFIGGGFSSGSHGSDSVEGSNSTLVALSDNCKFLYAQSSTYIANGGEGSRNRYNKLTIFENCIAYGNSRDGFNYVSDNDNNMDIVEINCQAFNNGLRGISESVNGSSSHRTSYILRLNCKYYNNYGPNVADQGGGITYNVGVECFNSAVPLIEAPNFDFNIQPTAGSISYMYNRGCTSYGSTHSFRISLTTEAYMINVGNHYGGLASVETPGAPQAITFADSFTSADAPAYIFPALSAYTANTGYLPIKPTYGGGGESIDVLTSEGIYQISTSSTGVKPTFTSRVFSVLRGFGSTFITQVAYGSGNSRVAVRSSSNSGTTWSAWLESAPLDSPALTGNPTAPTAPAGDNDLTIANTAFVTNAVSSGTYTPTLTGVTNITTIGTLENAYYTKIGNIVTVYVSFQVRPTATSANSEYTISLPVTRTSAPIAGTNCGEGMSFSGSDITLMRVRDMDTTKMQVVFTSINTTTGNASISFTYKTN